MSSISLRCRECKNEVAYEGGGIGYTTNCIVLGTYSHSHHPFLQVYDIVCDECGLRQEVGFRIAFADEVFDRETYLKGVCGKNVF